METPQTPETLEAQNQNPVDETLEYSSGFSGLADLSAGLSLEIPVAGNGETGCGNDVGIVNSESENEVVEDEKGIDVVEREILDFGEGASALADAEDNGVNHGGVESDRLIIDESEGCMMELDSLAANEEMEVSGDGLLLTVDFSSLEQVEEELFKSMGAEEVTKEDGDEEGVIENGQDCNFFIGDVIWVKTKSQTWWPGKVYNPSDVAKNGESDQSVSLLVGYFGSSHMTWCSPSQLLPFAENFEQISGKYKSRSFLGAVEKAVEEFGRRVKLGMTCSCIRDGNCSLEGDARSEERHQKFGSLGKFSVDQYEPVTFLALIKDLAQIVSLCGVLELSILYNQLTAFQSSLGHCQLPLHQLYETCDAENYAVGKSQRKSKVNGSEGAIAGLVEGGFQSSPLETPSIESIVISEKMDEKNGDPTNVEDGSLKGVRKSPRKSTTLNGGVESRSGKRIGSDELEDLESCKLDPSIKEEVINPMTNESKVSGVGNSSAGGKGIFEKSSETRERKKSKYLSFPYINWGPKSIPAETEDVEALKSPGEGMDTNVVEGQNEAPLLTKCSGKFWKKWFRNITSGNDVSGNQELINVSPAEFLSELYFTAVDCQYPNENKNFDSAAQFFSRFRISMFYDESVNAGQNEAMAANLFSPGGKGSEIKRPSASKSGSKKRKSKTRMEEMKSNKSSDDLDLIGKADTFLPGDSQKISQSTSKTKSRKDRESAGKLKTKSLSGLSDVKIDISNDNVFIKDSLDTGPLSPNGLPKRKKKKKDGSTFTHPQNKQTAEIPDLNGNGSISGLLVEDQQAMSNAAASQQKSQSKKRKNPGAAKAHLKFTSEVLDVNYSNKSDSFFIDIQVAAPQSPGVIPEQNILDFAKADVVPNQSMKDQQSVGQDQSKSEPRKRKRKEKQKPPLEGSKIGSSSDIPDLNGMGIESSQGKESQLANGISHQTKPKRKRRKKNEVNKPPDRPYIYNRVETGGESLGSLLLLTFSAGAPLPSKEQLITTFSQSGSLKESETRLKDSTAEIVFLKSADAMDAVRSLKKNNIFGPALLKYQLFHLSAPPRVSDSDRACTALAYPASEGHLNPTSEIGPQADDAPPLEFIRKNLQMMTSMLEKSGDNLSPDMRAKLEKDIESLLTKVSSMAGSSSMVIGTPVDNN